MQATAPTAAAVITSAPAPQAGNNAPTTSEGASFSQMLHHEINHKPAAAPATVPAAKPTPAATAATTVPVFAKKTDAPKVATPDSKLPSTPATLLSTVISDASTVSSISKDSKDSKIVDTTTPAPASIDPTQMASAVAAMAIPLQNSVTPDVKAAPVNNPTEIVANTPNVAAQISTPAVVAASQEQQTAQLSTSVDAATTPFANLLGTQSGSSKPTEKIPPTADQSKLTAAISITPAVLPNSLTELIGNSAGNSVQTVKAANQNLSAAQFNAIAPVLNAPVNSNAASDSNQSSNVIAPPVGTPDWNQSVGQKITWMAGNGQQTATLTLNPPDLGPMQVVINVHNQHASATFISHQPEVRAALESAIPKLREMMGQSGIQLGDCNVNSQSKQQQEFAQRQSTSSGTAINGIVGTVSLMPSGHTGGNLGLVDTFV